LQVPFESGDVKMCALQHTATHTHCNTLQHAVTHCNTHQQAKLNEENRMNALAHQNVAADVCSLTIDYLATVLQWVAVGCSGLQ